MIGSCDMEFPEKGTLKIWWLSNQTSDGFHYFVRDLNEAVATLNLLSKYDAYRQRRLNDKSSYRIGGLEVWDGMQWVEWYDENDYSINDYLSHYEDPKFCAIRNEETFIPDCAVCFAEKKKDTQNIKQRLSRRKSSS